MESKSEGNFHLGSDFVSKSDEEVSSRIFKCSLCKETVTDHTISADVVSNDSQEIQCLKCVQSESSKKLSRNKDFKDELLEGRSTEMEPGRQERPNTLEKRRCMTSQNIRNLSTSLYVNQGDYSTLKRHGSLMVRTSSHKSSLTSVANVSMITDFCDQHAGKVMEYYCTKDSKLLCSVCMQFDHDGCRSRKLVEYIPTYVENIDISKNLKEIMDKIREFSNMCNDQKDAATKKLSYITDMFRRVTEEIREFRKNINDKIDALEKQILKEVQYLQDDGTGHFIQACKWFDNTIEELRGLNFELLSCQQSTNAPQSFVVMKRSEEKMQNQNRVSGIYDKEETFDEYYFEANKKLELLLDSVNSFGHLRKRQHLTTVEIKQDGKLNVRSKDDKKLSWITGLTVLSESRIVVADQDNQMLKLIDAQKNLVLSGLKVSTKLHDVATILCDQFAATLPIQEKVQILSVYEDELSIQRSVKVRGKCHGIAFSPDDQHFCITMLEPASVQIVQLDGTVVREISQDENRKLLFSCPEYISVSKDGKYLYVSDYDNDSLTMLSVTGQVKSVFQGQGADKELVGPKAVFTSENDFVFLCGGDSNNIILLTNNCKNYKIILTHKDGLQNPVCLGELRQSDRTLLVVNGGPNSLTLYKYG